MPVTTSYLDGLLEHALAFSLPSRCIAEPAKRRIALWRKLKALGALYLQSGVCDLFAVLDRMKTFPDRFVTKFPDKNRFSDGNPLRDSSGQQSGGF